MLRKRVVPALLISDTGLVKTKKFRQPRYIGDAINSARIFNQMEVDELFLIDIRATSESRPIQFALVEQIVSECFMPISYGGGVRTVEDFRQLYTLGVEKISVSSLLFDNPVEVRKAVDRFGSQSVVATIDVKRSRLRRQHEVVTHNAKRLVSKDLAASVRAINDLGVGELVINDVDREGTWSGFDVDLLRNVAAMTGVPLVAMGGAGSLEHVRDAVTAGQVSAVALGSMAVFQAKDMGVLLNFPTIDQLAPYVGEK